MNTKEGGFQTVCLKTGAYTALETGSTAGLASGWHQQEKGRFRQQEARAKHAAGRNWDLAGMNKPGDPVSYRVNGLPGTGSIAGMPVPGRPAFERIYCQAASLHDGPCYRQTDADDHLKMDWGRQWVCLHRHPRRQQAHGSARVDAQRDAGGDAHGGDLLPHGGGWLHHRPGGGAAPGYAPIVTHRRK